MSRLSGFEKTARLLNLQHQGFDLREIVASSARNMLLTTRSPAYCNNLMEVGREFHRNQIEPACFLGFYSHLFRAFSTNNATSAETPDIHLLGALVKAIFFDIGWLLEAYEFSCNEQIVASTATGKNNVRLFESVNATQLSANGGLTGHQPAPGANLMDRGELGARIAYYDLQNLDTDKLAQIRSQLESRYSWVFNVFYRHFPNHSLTEPFFREDNSIDYLIGQQSNALDQLLSAQFNRRYAASRLQIGAVHEKIGLGPHLFIAGMGLTLTTAFEVLHESGKLDFESVQLLIDLFLFDASLILEAYLEQRRISLLKTDHYANNLIQRLPSGIALIDENLKIVSANHSLLQKFNLKGDLLKGLTLPEVIPSNSVRDYLLQTVKEGKTLEPLLCRSCGTNEGDYYRFTVLVLPRSDNLVDSKEYHAVIIDDLSALHKMGQDIRQIQSHLSNTIDGLDTLIWEARIRDFSPELLIGDSEKLFGHAPQELLASKSRWQFFFSGINERLSEIELIQALQTEGQATLQHSVDIPETGTLWLQSHIRVGDDEEYPDNGKICGVTVDVTESIQARTRVERTLTTTKLLFQLSQQLLVKTRIDDVISTAIDALTEIFPDLRSLGFCQQSMAVYAAGPDSLEPETNQNLIDRILLHSRDILQNATSTDQYIFCDDGSCFWIYTPYAEVEAIISIHRRDTSGSLTDEQCNTFDLLLNMVKLSLGRIISDTVATQNQKMAAMGTFASGVAHDFNNILASISFCAEWMALCGSDAPDSEDKIAMIQNCVERGKNLIENILVFSRKNEKSTGPSNWSEETQHIFSLRSDQPDMPKITVDIQQVVYGRISSIEFEQILNNLLQNALHVTPEDGTIGIIIDRVFVRNNLSTITGTLPRGHYAHLSVTDQGKGISRHHLPRIFEPFYSTKEIGKGVGLGLAIIHGLTLGAGGRVHVVSSRNGTRFDVYIPATPQPTNPLTRNPDKVSPGNMVILLVDDDLSMLESGQTLLQAHGHTVFSTSDAIEGLEILTDNESIEAVVVDYSMPKINGIEFIQRALELGVSARFVILTGMATEKLRESARRDNITLLPKPTSIEQIHRALASAEPGPVV